MSRLEIPPHHKQGLKKLRLMEPSEFDTLLSKLVLRTEQAKMSELESDIASVQNMTQEDAKGIVSALVSMHISISTDDEPTESFAEDAINSLEGTELADSEGARVSHDTFKSRLVSLLNLEAFRIASKAINLQGEFDRVFCRARIFTDLRPVFGSDVIEGPKGAVVVHMLHLRYHPSDSAPRHREFQIALDTRDLKKLKTVIERAEAKQKALEATLKKAGIPRLAE